MTLRSPQTRKGLTLLEVIVAMAIFLMSLVAIYELVSIGGERAVEVKWKSRTSLRCQSKLNEIIVGAEPLSNSGSFSTFPDDTDTPQMQWKMESTPAAATNLYNIKVTVKVELSTGKTIDSQLCQMVLDPAKRGSTMDQPNVTPAGTPTPDSATTPAAAAPAAAAPAAAAPAKAAPAAAAPAKAAPAAPAPAAPASGNKAGAAAPAKGG